MRRRRSTRVDAPPPSSSPPPPPSSSLPLPISGSQTIIGEHAAATSCVDAPWWNSLFPGGSIFSSSPATSTDKQASQAMAAENTFQSFPAELSSSAMGKDPRPVGGFVNFMQNGLSFSFPQQFPHHTPMPQNIHLGSGPTPAHYAPFLPPRPPVSKEIPSPSLNNLSSSQQPSGSQSNQFVDVDSQEDGEVRTNKRLIWNPDEDLRLMSSWINNSTDPINGIYKKNEQYWNDVVAVYNSTTPKNRWRSAKQAKDRWHAVNRLVYQFQYSWNKAYKIYSSGQSDDQLMDKAHAFYVDDWGGQFLLVKVWKAVRGEPKWHNYNNHLEESQEKREDE